MTGAIGRELERAKEILKRHGFALELAAGASRDDLARAERTTGLSFDNELGELFSTANGSFGKTCFAVQTEGVTACCLASLDAALERWSDWLPHSTDDGSRDPKRINPARYVRPTCFPFAELNRWGTAVYFDLNASELGTPAVIAYQHNPDAMYVVGESLAAFLSRSNALLEQHARDLLFVDGRPSVLSPKRL